MAHNMVWSNVKKDLQMYPLEIITMAPLEIITMAEFEMTTVYHFEGAMAFLTSCME